MVPSRTPSLLGFGRGQPIPQARTPPMPSTANPPPSKGGTHPLKHSWSISFLFRSTSKLDSDWSGALRHLGSFGSIESFWLLFSHLSRPSMLPSISDIHIFQSSIRPVWEDPANASGGKFLIRLKKGVEDRVWEEVAMALVGEMLVADAIDGEEDDGDGAVVCGIVMSVRSNECVLSVWNKDKDDKKGRERIRGGILKVLHRLWRPPAGITATEPPANFVSVEYKPHPLPSATPQPITPSTLTFANLEERGNERSEGYFENRPSRGRGRRREGSEVEVHGGEGRDWAGKGGGRSWGMGRKESQREIVE
ncbi:translation initiation factor eIF4e [Atractiella rhizophila]|nr:translation initiation factor eIF4e [Atractiella rhizophila]